VPTRLAQVPLRESDAIGCGSEIAANKIVGMGAVEREHVMPGSGKVPHQVAADEAVGAGDEDSGHAAQVLSVRNFSE
jgi:hypothetical protein